MREKVRKGVGDRYKRSCMYRLKGTWEVGTCTTIGNIQYTCTMLFVCTTLLSV